MAHVPHRCGTVLSRRDGLSRLWKHSVWDEFSFLTKPYQETVMLKPALAIAMIGFVAIAAGWAASAQQAPAISVEQATKIARDAGLAMIREIELDDGKWEIEGRTQAGERRELHIDATSGKTLRNERD
jgi:glucose dehydrogenase